MKDNNLKKFKLDSSEESRKAQRALLEKLRMISMQDIAAMLCQAPEDDLWSLIRDTLLAIRVNVVKTEVETPYVRAIEYLYALTRFVEISRRYPFKEEQGHLFEELQSKRPIREDRYTAEVVKLLLEASQNPSNREAAKQLNERARFYRKADNIQLDTIPIFDEQGNLLASASRFRRKANRKKEPRGGGE